MVKTLFRLNTDNNMATQNITIEKDDILKAIAKYFKAYRFSFNEYNSLYTYWIRKRDFDPQAAAAIFSEQGPERIYQEKFIRFCLGEFEKKRLNSFNVSNYNSNSIIESDKSSELYNIFFTNRDIDQLKKKFSKIMMQQCVDAKIRNALRNKNFKIYK